MGILIHRTIAAACKTTRPASSQAVVLLMDIKTLCKRKNRRRPCRSPQFCRRVRRVQEVGVGGGRKNQIKLPTAAAPQ